MIALSFVIATMINGAAIDTSLLAELGGGCHGFSKNIQTISTGSFHSAKTAYKDRMMKRTHIANLPAPMGAISAALLLLSRL